MWPSSPAPPRPRQSAPSSTMPPPTPVPHHMPRNDRYVRPAPSTRSASTATRTSFPTRTGTPRSADSSAPTGYSPSQLGRLPARATVPLSVSTSPGEPTPTPESSDTSTPASAAAARIAAASSATTAAGPPSVGVACRAALDHVLVVHDEGLDLRAAEIQSAAHAHRRTIVL